MVYQAMDGKTFNSTDDGGSWGLEVGEPATKILTDLWEGGGFYDRAPGVTWTENIISRRQEGTCTHQEEMRNLQKGAQGRRQKETMKKFY